MEKLQIFSNVLAWMGVFVWCVSYIHGTVRNRLLKTDIKYALQEAVAGRGRSYVPMWVDLIGIAASAWLLI